MVAVLSEQNISQASYFENSLFRIKQLTTLFAAQGVLLYIDFEFFTFTLRCKVVRVIALQSFFSPVTLQVYL